MYVILWKSPLERPLRSLENTIRRYEINMYVHDKAILKTDVGMSICSDSSTIWDWAWNSCFGSLTCLSKFTNFCGNARNVNFCMGRTETLKQVVQTPNPWQRGQAVCVSLEKYWISQNIEKQFSWVRSHRYLSLFFALWFVLYFALLFAIRKYLRFVLR